MSTRRQATPNGVESSFKASLLDDTTPSEKAEIPNFTASNSYWAWRSHVLHTSLRAKQTGYVLAKTRNPEIF